MTNFDEVKYAKKPYFMRFSVLLNSFEPTSKSIAWSRLIRFILKAKNGLVQPLIRMNKPVRHITGMQYFI